MNPIMMMVAISMVLMLATIVGYAILVIVAFALMVLHPPPKVSSKNHLNTATIDKLLSEIEDESRRHGMSKSIFSILELYISDESDIKSVTCTDPDMNQWCIELWGARKEVVFIEENRLGGYISDIYSKKEVTNRNIFKMMESHYPRDEVISMMKSDPMGTILLALECKFENEN